MRGETRSSLPVFPLGQVLFPEMPLSLHIFEERYKAMLRDLPEMGNRFVVALIREGVEVGGEAEPYEIGCVAEVIDLQQLSGESLLVRTIGRERVKIEALDRESKPYLLGLVEALPEDPAPAEHDLIARVSRAFGEYARVLLSVSGETVVSVDLPKDQLTLSSLVASMLQVPPEKKQSLLELPGSAARLKAETSILRVELPLLRALVDGPRG